MSALAPANLEVGGAAAPRQLLLARRALPWFFGVWLAGAQLAELFAVIGVCGTALCVGAELAVLRPKPRLALHWSLLLGFVAAALLVPTLAGRPPTGTGAARLLNLLTIPLGAAAVSRLEPTALRRALLAGGAVLLVSSLVAGLQHFGAWFRPESLEALGPLRLPFHRVYEEVPGAPGRYMGGGLLFHRLKFAHVSSLAVICAAGLALRLRGRDRLLALGAAAVGLVAILWFPFARAALVALVVSLVATVVGSAASAGGGARRGWPLLIAATIAAALGLALALHAPLRERILRAGTTEGSGARAEIRAAGLRALGAHPIAGVGVGRFQLKEWASAGAPEYVSDNPGKSHNQLLSVAIESGVPAALLFGAALVAIGVRLWRRRQELPHGLGLLCFFLLLSALHDPLFQAEFGLALGAALGAALAERREAAGA